MLPLDLHVLGLPPAFNLSHDQTLQFKVCRSNKLANKLFSHSFNLISFGYQHSQTSAHTDCLINFLKSVSLPKWRQEVDYSAILFCCQENVLHFLKSRYSLLQANQ
ncbi:Uncharacterised protein [Plesiomonas shigelloides]|nr:Uncharacterised protein [Plesiomonas shigelloides]